MNRLILVGNGFDLAHELKTSYNDFIKYYLTECFAVASDAPWIYEDGLISIRNTKEEYIEALKHKNEGNLIDKCYGERLLGMLITNEKLSYKGGQLTHPFHVVVNSRFFANIVSSCHIKNWVAIEDMYYQELVSILKGIIDIEGLLLNLNATFGLIIEALNSYLSKLDRCWPVPQYQDIFTGPILKQEIPSRVNEEDASPENIMALCFNYTGTLHMYNQNEDKLKLNFIHGRINSEDNPIIFGFGDEHDLNYPQIEATKVNKYFEYIKSFAYTKTTNYHNLIRFIDASPFQVLILGHSCGLSDRTMLKMIFEHKNCEAIKIYYHGDSERNNYISLTHEISRHFSDKSMMRKKLTPEPLCKRMPQA